MSATSRLIAAATLGTGALLLAGCAESPSTKAEETAPATGQATPATPTEAGTDGDYTAGEYAVTGTYTVPEGRSQITVDLTLTSAGVVEALTVTPLATNGNSLKFQTLFADGIGDSVVGKPITEVSVSKVSGSSLTSAGFNAAVEAIIKEAQA